MCVCRTEQTKGWIEQSRVEVRADILSSGELKHKNTSLCSLCALTALPLPPLNMPSYPLIELHPDSTFDHRGEATITHNEYSHLITRCWKYSSHNLAISQSNGSFSGANALNSAAIQIDRAGGNGKQKNCVPSSAFQFPGTWNKQKTEQTQIMAVGLLKFYVFFSWPQTADKRKRNGWTHASMQRLTARQVDSCPALLMLLQHNTQDPVRLFFTWWCKANEQALFPYTLFFFFLSTHCTHTPTVRRNWYIFLFFWLFLQRRFNYSIPPPKREGKEILYATKPQHTLSELMKGAIKHFTENQICTRVCGNLLIHVLERGTDEREGKEQDAGGKRKKNTKKKLN